VAHEIEHPLDGGRVAPDCWEIRGACVPVSARDQPPGTSRALSTGVTLKRSFFACATACLYLTACATTDAAWRPTIDPSGVNQVRYDHDLAECRQIAEQTPGTDASKEGKKIGTKTGLLAGAGLVALTVATGGLGAIAFLPAMAVSAAVTVGGVGAAAGAAQSQGAKAKYENIISNCLVQRGYRVVGGLTPLGQRPRR
jgi:hypothetical protein